jgi:hypothetical protein
MFIMLLFPGLRHCAPGIVLLPEVEQTHPSRLLRQIAPDFERDRLGAGDQPGGQFRVNVRDSVKWHGAILHERAAEQGAIDIADRVGSVGKFAKRPRGAMRNPRCADRLGRSDWFERQSD